MVFLKSNDTSYEIIILIGLAVVGILVKLFLSPSSSKLGDTGPATASIWGYGITAFSLFTLFFIIFSLANNASGNVGILSVLFSAIPILFLLCVIVSLIVLNGMFLDRINKGNVPKDYANLSIISSVLIVLQLAFAVIYIMNKLKLDKNSAGFNQYIALKASQMANISYLFGVFNVLAVGGSYIILNYFSTDG